MVQFVQELQEFRVAMLWVSGVWQHVHHVRCYIFYGLFLFRFLLLGLCFFLDVSCLLDQLRWWLEDRACHWTAAHHHWVHPRLLERLARGHRISAGHLSLWLSSYLRRWIPDRVQINWLLIDMCEVILHWRVSNLHILELLCHHLLVLSLCKLGFHHRHCLRVSLHLGIHVSFCSLSSSSIAHHHVLHHIGKGIGTDSTLLCSIRLACATCHDFIEHRTLVVHL